MLLWMLLLIAAYVAAVLLLPDQMTALSEKLRELAGRNSVDTSALLPAMLP